MQKCTLEPEPQFASSFTSYVVHLTCNKSQVGKCKVVSEVCAAFSYWPSSLQVLAFIASCKLAGIVDTTILTAPVGFDYEQLEAKVRIFYKTSYRLKLQSLNTQASRPTYLITWLKPFNPRTLRPKLPSNSKPQKLNRYISTKVHASILAKRKLGCNIQILDLNLFSK